MVALIYRRREARAPLALAILAILWSAGLAGVLAHPFGPLRSITAHQAVRALPLLAFAIAILAGLALGKPGSRPSPWLVVALTVLIALDRAAGRAPERAPICCRPPRCWPC